MADDSAHLFGFCRDDLSRLLPPPDTAAADKHDRRECLDSWLQQDFAEVCPRCQLRALRCVLSHAHACFCRIVNSLVLLKPDETFGYWISLRGQNEENVYRLLSQINESDEARVKLSEHVEFLRGTGEGCPAWLDELGERLKTRGIVTWSDLVPLLVIESLEASLAKAYRDRSSTQLSDVDSPQQVSEGFIHWLETDMRRDLLAGILQTVNTLFLLQRLMKKLVLAGIDSWLHPLLGSKPGEWTTALLRTLTECSECAKRLMSLRDQVCPTKEDGEKLACGIDAVFNAIKTLSSLDDSVIPRELCNSEKTPARVCRLRADIEACNAWLDETPFLVPRRSAIYLQAIIDNEQKPGRKPLSGPAIHKQYPEFPRTKASEYKLKLPPQIRALIHTDCDGAILLPDAWTSNP